MSLEEDAQSLAQVDLFANISPKKLKLLALASRRLSFDEGQSICIQGEEGDEAYIVIDGTADVLIGANGSATKVASLKANDIVGELAILRDMPRTATVTATSAVKTLCIAKNDFLSLLTEFPEMSVEILRTLSDRLADTTSELVQARTHLKEGA